MQQLALFGPPEPLPDTMNMVDIPFATDVNGYAISLRGGPAAYNTTVDGIDYEISGGGAIVYMTLSDHRKGSIRFKDYPHAHWRWEAYRDGAFKTDVCDSRVAALHAILNYWKEETE